MKSFYKKIVLNTLNKMVNGRLHLTLPGGSVVNIGGDDRIIADLNFKSDDVYLPIVLYGDIGFAEAYMDGEWETSDLSNLIRWFILNIEHTPGVSGSKTNAFLFNALQLFNKITHLGRENSVSGSRKNISAHYDLSNEFFSLFLDSTMTYSSGLFLKSDESLEEAQFQKYDSLCKKAAIKEGEHVLEIGTGWGGFAVHAAKNYNVKVTTVTISEEQYKYAIERVKQNGLEDKVQVLLKDYRKIEGKFDKVVSIEMIEAVGAKYLKAYFKKIHEVLKPNGVLALQAIVCPDNRFEEFKRKVDFIQKHIFPGSLLPSISAINTAINETGEMFLFGARDMGKSYAKTLATWRETFNEKAEAIKELGFDEVFLRKWNYYFSYCEAAFDMRNINVVQLVYTRPNNYTFKPEQ